jgi:hypothetical protein
MGIFRQTQHISSATKPAGDQQMLLCLWWQHTRRRQCVLRYAGMVLCCSRLLHSCVHVHIAAGMTAAT